MGHNGTQLFNHLFFDKHSKVLNGRLRNSTDKRMQAATFLAIKNSNDCRESFPKSFAIANLEDYFK